MSGRLLPAGTPRPLLSSAVAHPGREFRSIREWCIRYRRVLLRFCLVLLVLSGGPGFGWLDGVGPQSFGLVQTARAQEDSPASAVAGRGDGFHRVFVPEDLVQQVLRPGWVPVSRQKLNRLLEASRVQEQRPDPAVLTSARWTATLAGDLLTGGRFQGEVSIAEPADAESGALSAEAPQLMILPRSNLAWQSLLLDGKPAVWGTLNDGRTAVALPRDRRTVQLTGTWEYRGRQLARSLECRLALWPALSSTVELVLAAGLTVESNAGETEGPLPADRFRPAFAGPETEPQSAVASDSAAPSTEVPRGLEDAPPREPEARAVWRLAAGSLSELTVSVLEPLPRATPPMMMFSQSDMTCVVREAGVEVSVDFSLEVLDGQTDLLLFRLPDDFQVHSVQLAGAVAGWRVLEQDDHRQLEVSLPVAIRGPGRPVQVRGEVPLKLGGGWELPALQLLDSVFVERNVHLQVTPPLELHGHSEVDTRQTEAVTSSEGEAILSFRQTSADARLTADIGYPRQVVGVQSLSLLTFGERQWQIQSELVWQVQSGTAWQVQCTVPAGWRITDVQGWNRWPEGAATGESALSSWSTRPNPDGSQLLLMEFLEALTPSRAGLVRIRALRTTAGGAPTDRLPIIQPIGAGTISTAVAVEHSASRHFELTRPGPFQRIDLTRLPAIARTLPLWQRIKPPNLSHQLFVSTTPDASGRLRLSSVRPLYSSRVLVTVDVSRHSIRQRWQISLEDVETSGGQIHVWLPGRLPDLIWTLADDPSTVLPCHVLDPAEFPEWMLDAGGTLLAIDIGGHPAADLTIAAERTFPFSLPWVPALAFVPGSSRFDAEVELRLRGTECAIQTRGMEQVASRVEPSAGSEHSGGDFSRNGTGSPTGELATPGQLTPAAGSLSSGGASPLHSVNRWEYQSIADSLTLVPESAQQAATAVSGARLELHSDFRMHGGTAQHRAVFHIPAGESTGAFIVQQPDVPGPVLCFLDGRPIPAGTEEPAIHRLPLSVDQSHQVELRYSTTFVAGGIAPSLSIPLPETPHPVAGFQWQIKRDGALRLLTAPAGLVTSVPPDQISWFSRLFGPAGRSLHRKLFNPFVQADWQDLWSPQPADAEGSTAAPGSLSAAGPLPGTSISIQFWNADAASRIAWVCLLLALLTGWLLRHRQADFRGRAGAAVLGICLAGCCFLSPPGALICGGVVSGLLLSACLPRRLVQGGTRGSWSPDEIDQVPTGSTATYRMGLPLLLLAVVLQWLQPAIAQNSGSRPQARGAATSETPAESPERRNELIIPVDQKQQPSAKLPVAWLHYSRLAELQRAANTSSQPEFDRVLIRSFRWTGQLPESGAADLTATCEVIVLPGTVPAVLSLPFQGGNLAGPQPCTVDGQPREVTRDPATGNLQVQLAGTGIHPTDEILLPATAEVADAVDASAEAQAAQSSQEFKAKRPPVIAPLPGRSSTADSFGTTRHLVVLKLRVPVQTRLTDRSFTIHCPPANAAELQLQVFSGCGQAHVEQALGGASCDSATGKLRARLGSCTEFTISAAAGAADPTMPGAVVEPPKMTADIATLIDVTPNLLNHQTRIQFQTDQEPVDFVRLRLPPGAILRAAATEQPHRSTILPSSADGSREILIELTEAGSRNVTARLSFVVPRVRNSPEIDVPVPDLLPRNRVDGFRLVRRSSLAAVSHPLEMQLQHTRAREPACVPVPVQEFLDAWGEASLPRRPRFAFRIDGPAAIRLARQDVLARREAQLEQTILVTRHRLEVLLQATLTTYDAPAFDHVLLTDPELRISSVSVTEDQANRLQRWSHLDGRLVLYLSGRTTGTQQIQIRGSLPLQGNSVTSLPKTGLEEGRVTRTLLDLYRTRDAEVRPGWTGGLPDPNLPAAGTGTEGDSGSGRSGQQNATRRELVRDAVPLSHVAAEGELPELQLISVTPVTEPLVAESVLLVGREGREGLLPVEIRLRLTGGLRQLPVLQLRIPAAPDEPFRLVDSGRLRPIRPELRPDGSQLLSFDTSEVQSSAVLILKTSILARDGLELHLPAVDGAVNLPAIAILGQELVPGKTGSATASAAGTNAAAAENSPERDQGSPEPPDDSMPVARPLDPEMLPTWISEGGIPPFVSSWEMQPAPQQSLVWQLTTPAQQGPRPPRVRLLLTTLWLNGSGTLSGTTEMILDPGDAAGLTLEWPEGTIPGSAMIGQTPVQPVFNSNREVELTIPANGAPALVQITWERLGAGGMSPFSGRQVPLPAVRNADVLRELVLISSPPETSMTISSTGLRGDGDDVATLVIAALLEAVQSAANDGLIEGDLHQLLATAVESDAVVANRQPQSLPDGEDSSRLPLLIGQAEEKLDRLSHTLPASGSHSTLNGLSSVFTLLNRPPGDAGFVVVLPPEEAHHRPVSHTIGIQLLGTSPLRWLAALMLALALAIVLPGVVQRDWGDRLSQHQLVVLALLGTAWWAMLAAGGAGFLVLLLAGGIAVRRVLLAHFRPPETELRI